MHIKIILLALLLSMHVSSAYMSGELRISPQLKFGKEENGNGFMEMQYFKFRLDISEKYTLQGGLSTGFTSPRNSILTYNHAVNRAGLKFTYRPFDRLGVFYEGNIVQHISGATHPVTYLVYNSYQAVGLNWDIKTYLFSKPSQNDK